MANKFTRLMHRTGLQLKKHSPEILITVGVVGTVASAVMACRATLKVNDIIVHHKETINKIEECENDATLIEQYTPEDAKKDKIITYRNTGIELVKLYAPSVILGALSLTSIVASNNILRKRNIGLAAAYATIDHSFKEYRGRVIERFGKELDKELKYGVKTEKIEERVVDENGNETVESKLVETVYGSEPSEYARFFDETCTAWDRNAEYNLKFLKDQQKHANIRLQKQGHLFLNEVYDMLGIPRTQAGNIVGWIYDETNSDGDSYVDFGIYDIHNAKAREFVNGHERSILLDFNVQGDVWSLLNWKDGL